MKGFYAIIRKSKESDFGVEFPDLPGCITAGKTMEEAMRFAREAALFHLEGRAEWPLPSTRDMLIKQGFVKGDDFHGLFYIQLDGKGRAA